MNLRSVAGWLLAALIGACSLAVARGGEGDARLFSSLEEPDSGETRVDDEGEFLDEQPPLDVPAATGSDFFGDEPQPDPADDPFADAPPKLIFPRLGLLPVFPAGPGYYSAWECLRGVYRQERPPQPWGPISLKPFPFYDVDFRYLDDPDNTYFMWSDFLKRRRIGDGWLFSTGGEVRNRFLNDIDEEFVPAANRIGQLRTIVYGSLYYYDDLGVFVQFIDGQRSGPPQRTVPDRNPADLLDLFVDLKLFEWEGAPVFVRGGRQEIILGSQRLVSNLDWSNIMRTFQGVRLFRQGEKWDATAFWLQPIIPNPSSFDSPDENQNFTGIWTTYRAKPGNFWDLYVLNLENSNPVATGEGGVVGGTNVTTLGTRIIGDFDKTWLYEWEVMLQVGRYSNQNLRAGATTVGGGYVLKDVAMKPQIWIYYDFASGDANPGVGDTFGTFNQLYPFGRYYLGYLDTTARQNIQDFNIQITFFPTDWITVLVQHHKFNLAQARSPLFGPTGRPERVDPTGAAGTDVGNELDVAVNFHLTAHQDILVGYSKYFPGRFIRETGPDVAPELVYVQHQLQW